ncbi:MAG: hypothetical protein AAF429_06495 [Pseudomonadota bacterium]
MSIKSAHLNKLLKAFALQESKLVSLLRSDIRNEQYKSQGFKKGGGDFHGPFWADAKDYVLHGTDLEQLIKDRIEANECRKRLYPELAKGFLDWWNNKKRFSNEKIEPYPLPLKARLAFKDLDAEVKIENLLVLSVGDESKRIIYPYFTEEPELSEIFGRIGLWALCAAFPSQNPDNFRILDVLRGTAISIENTPFLGTEEETFRLHLERIIEKWERLKTEY